MKCDITLTHCPIYMTNIYCGFYLIFLFTLKVIDYQLQVYGYYFTPYTLKITRGVLETLSLKHLM